MGPGVVREPFKRSHGTHFRGLIGMIRKFRGLDENLLPFHRFDRDDIGGKELAHLGGRGLRPPGSAPNQNHQVHNQVGLGFRV